MTEKSDNALTLLEGGRKSDMTPLAEFPPKSRFGVLIRRARNEQKRSLRDVAVVALDPPVEGEKDHRSVIYGELERGKRPPSEDVINAVLEVLDLDRELLLQAARDWHEAVWSSDAVVLDGAEFSIASLAPTRHQTDELRDELQRVLVDLEDLTTTVEEVGDGIAARVEVTMSRMRATLADSDGPKQLPLGEFPDIKLGNTNELNPCQRCNGFGKDPDVEEVEGIQPWELRCKDCEGTGQYIQRFEIDHVYVDMTGRLMHILGGAVSTAYGVTLVAERSDIGDFVPVAGGDREATIGWREVPKSVWWKHWIAVNPGDGALKKKLLDAERSEGPEAGDGCKIPAFEIDTRDGIRIVINSGWEVDDDWLERVNGALVSMAGTSHVSIVEQARTFIVRGLQHKKLRKV